MKLQDSADTMATLFIRYNFQPHDRLAVFLVNKCQGDVIQRIASAERIADRDFQGWLHDKNSERYEVYLSMNALKDNAISRTRNDIAAIRHIYLDFDQDGTAMMNRLLSREGMPGAHHLVHTSPDKWHVLWKVEGFTIAQAEALQQALARESGANLAATDCARVLWLPGFDNHKYWEPHEVRAEFFPQEPYRPDQFPAHPDKRLTPLASEHDISGKDEHRPQPLSESEKDWAYAVRALRQGIPRDDIIGDIAVRRRFEESNAVEYAHRTVDRAVEHLAAREPRSFFEGSEENGDNRNKQFLSR